MENTDPALGDPLDAVIASVDALIQAGGASAEELADLKMDLEDCKMGGEEPMSEYPDAGIAGLIGKAQGGRT